MSLAKAKNINSIVLPPVVSHDPNSQISQMARDAKKLQVQSQIDSKYDTVLARDGTRVSYDTNTLAENFSSSMDEYPDKTVPLLIVSTILTVLLVYGVRARLRK